MKKILIAVLSCFATIAIAETDYVAMPRIEAIVSGEETLPVLRATSVVAGAVTGDTLAIPAGYFTVINTTNLVFIASGVTNVIDADIKTN